jgi:hypothetical protein
MKSRPQNHFEALLPNGQIAYSNYYPIGKRKAQRAWVFSSGKGAKILGLKAKITPKSSSQRYSETWAPWRAWNY